MPLRLSVLDLVPVRTDQSSGDAIAATIALAKTADELGFERYWVAEHHNMPAVAATNPPVLISMLAAHTRRIRVGSGGVMLPNHAPLVVAEQFGMLEAAYPRRIDLGIGRAPGTDPVTSLALRYGAGDATSRQPGRPDPAVSRFPEYVQNVITLLEPAGAMVRVGDREHALRATPAATSTPSVWLLGSSDYSARLAGHLGLPYVFAHHFSGRGTAEALALYRSSFRPTERTPEPSTLLTVNVAVGETEEEARRLVLPQGLSMLALRTGAALTPQRLVEEAESVGIPPGHEELFAAMTGPWVVGTPEQVRGRLAALAGEYGVDEVMVNPIAGAFAGTSPTAAPQRERTLRALGDPSS